MTDNDADRQPTGKQFALRVTLALLALAAVLIGAASFLGASLPVEDELVFMSDRSGNGDIYRMDVRRRVTARLTKHFAADFAPAWSADGARIIFSSDRTGAVLTYMMDDKGGNVQPLADGLEAPIDSPARSPDGAWTWFMAFEGGNLDIYLLETTSGNVRRLTNHPALDDAPSWRPAVG